MPLDYHHRHPPSYYPPYGEQQLEYQNSDYEGMSGSSPSAQSSRSASSQSSDVSMGSNDDLSRGSTPPPAVSFGTKSKPLHPQQQHYQYNGLTQPQQYQHVHSAPSFGTVHYPMPPQQRPGFISQPNISAPQQPAADFDSLARLAYEAQQRRNAQGMMGRFDRFGTERRNSQGSDGGRKDEDQRGGGGDIQPDRIVRPTPAPRSSLKITAPPFAAPNHKAGFAGPVPAVRTLKVCNEQPALLAPSLPSSFPLAAAKPLPRGPISVPQQHQHQPRGQEGYRAAARTAPATGGNRTVHVRSNVWQLECDDRMVYRYDVSIELEAIGKGVSTKMISVNKGPKDDASVSERNVLIREVLKRGLEENRILSNTGCIAADGSAMMYANEELGAALKQYDHRLTVPVEHLSDEARKFIRSSNVKHVIIEVGNMKSFPIKDLSGQTSIDRSDLDQSVKQFFEVITSEHALNSRTYSFFTGGNLYREDPDRIRMGGGNKFARPLIDKKGKGTGQERRDGMTKGFTLAEKNGSIIAALNIDVTTGTFWSEGKLVDTICDINGWPKAADAAWDYRTVNLINDRIKNLRVTYTPADGGRSFDFVAAGITARAWLANGKETGDLKSIGQLTYKNEDDGLEQPLLNKFPNFNPRLLYWPLIETKRVFRRADNPDKFVVRSEFYPIELLSVKANQRVPLAKQGADPDTPMVVQKRWTETAKALDALNLFGDTRTGMTNPVMEAFGIRLARAPLETKGITRAMPTVTFNRGAQIDSTTSFRTGSLAFHTPAHITHLFICCSEARRNFDETAFTNALLAAARAKKIRIDSHSLDLVPPHELHDVLMKIRRERSKQEGDKYKRVVFIYVEPEASHHHDHLKLFERRHSIVTQHLTTEVAGKMITSKPTMENVLLKLNVKGGGHNYNVKPEAYANDLWMGRETMIMGYDVWHPTGMSRQDIMADRLPDPSVVGFAFNGGVLPDSFVGDYHFQEKCKERVADDVLNARIKWMLRIFEENGKALPPLIIVIRDGISDGQYTQGMDELEALREGAREYAASAARTAKTGKPPVNNYSPKFIFVVATKRHNKRMYANIRGAPANMPAMTAVDDTITNPVLFEFFLQSHTPLKGMAKATRYTVLKDDVGTNMDAMQSLMGALCFEHQISTNAISIPEPVYQSDEWAKRGAANVKMFKELYGYDCLLENERISDARTLYTKLTEKLSYWNSELERVRVNA